MITVLLTLLGAAAITAAVYLLSYIYDTPEEESFCKQQGGSLMRGHLAVCRWSPDSDLYLKAHTERPPRPFHRRPLIPRLANGSTKRWHAITAGSLVATGPALAWYLMLSGVSPALALAGVASYALLWGGFRLLALVPVLVDAPANLAVIVGAALYQATGSPWLLAGAGLVSATIRESAPVFMSLTAWHPASLVGLLYTAFEEWRGAPEPASDALKMALKHPWQYARNFRNGTVFTHIMVSPWGLLLPLALLNPSWQLFAALAVAYGQTFQASDNSRLTQCAAPVVIAAALACPYVPPAFWPLVVLAGLVSPWQKPLLESQPVRLQKAA